MYASCYYDVGCVYTIIDEHLGLPPEPKWDNKAKHRTHSSRWRAGARMNKPKHNWSLKKRGKK